MIENKNPSSPAEPDWFKDTLNEAPEEVRRKFLEEAQNHLIPLLHHMIEALARVQGLIGVAANSGDSRDDILRAAVVLTHAYLEDFIRTVARNLLPTSENALNDVPFAGGRGPGERLTLGQFARQHRDKSVEEVVRQSVEEYLDKYSFSNTNKIVGLLKNVGLTLGEELKDELPTIQAMIERRHHIVHQADRIKNEGSDTYGLQAITPAEVRRWLDTTHSFLTGLLTPIMMQRMSPLSADFATKWLGK